MSTPQSPSASAAETRDQRLPEFIFDLRADGGIHITFNPQPGPPTQGGNVLLTYKRGERSLGFRSHEIHSDVVRGLGLSLTVTLEQHLDAGSTTATVLFPDIHLSKPSTIAVETILITTTQDRPMVVTIDGQRDHYSVTPLTGEATKPVAWPLVGSSSQGRV